MLRTLPLLFFCLLCHISFAEFDPARNIQFRSARFYPGETGGNIWGHVDSLGNEYALMCASQGLSIVNVTNPDSIWEVVRIPGVNNLWREVKTWQGFAYVTTEGGGGLQIVDLRPLPNPSLPYKNYYKPVLGTPADSLRTIHALHIDNGKLYLYGANLLTKGILRYSLNDPWNPVYLNGYQDHYVHDGIVRNDTAWAGQIYNGSFAVVDFNAGPQATVLQTQTTPGLFTHNTWLNDESTVLFTTDEVSNSYLAAYDVSNLQNITELGRVRSNPGSGSIVHNTLYKNGYCINSWYKDGCVIVDAHKPYNLVQVGNYDTYRTQGSDFHGSWGVYPYLPSGNILISNLDTAVSNVTADAGGLYVVTPTYTRASYLEGTVVDSLSGNPIINAKLTLYASNGDSTTTLSGLDGGYRFGIADTGNLLLSIRRAVYTNRNYTVNLQAGETDSVTVRLLPLSSSVGTMLSQQEPIIWPNPSYSGCTIQAAEPLPTGSFWEIRNCLGQLVEQVVAQQTGNQYFSFAQLPAGWYTIGLATPKGMGKPVRFGNLR
jgi:choice-of-anchor B domain-containing protein